MIDYSVIGDDPWIDPEELRASNNRHDAELASLGLSGCHHSGTAAGKPMVNIIGARLTDRKITRYARLGFYDSEYRTARKANAEKKRKSQGNFDLQDGRLIYRP